MIRRVKLIAMTCLLSVALPMPALASKTHKVRTSETLYSISRKYNISVDELKAANNINSNRIAKGTSLIIPSRSESPQPIENCNTYTVESGDSLFGIARKTGKQIADLRRINKIKGNQIKPGQVLVLSDTPATCDIAAARQARNKNLKLVNNDLLNEEEFANTLAELTDLDSSDRPVNLARQLGEQETAFSAIKKSAYSFLGARYRFGGNSRNALDCSSFTQQVFREHNINLPRTAREQFRVGDMVATGDLRRGDLVFFRTYAPFPSHVGIYLGNGKMIHASSTEHRVIVSSMNTNYYLSRYIGARRLQTDSAAPIDLNELIFDVEEEIESDADNNDHLGINTSVSSIRK